MTYGDEFITCDGTCTYCVPGCSRYQITLCIICGEMIQEGNVGCYEHSDSAEELNRLRKFYKDFIDFKEKYET